MPSWKNKRWYDDACATAFALELIGERWALLIVRELMLGARRFTELRAGLGGISAKSLSERLEGLEAAGILRRRALPRPLDITVYELSPWGYEALPIFEAIGRWSLRSPLHDTSLPLSPVAAMLSLRTTLRPARVTRPIMARFRFGEDRFRVALDPGGLLIEREDDPYLSSERRINFDARRMSERASLEFELDTLSFRRVFYGKKPIEDEEAAGSLRLQGDRALAERFIAAFALPPKISG